MIAQQEIESLTGIKHSEAIAQQEIKSLTEINHSEVIVQQEIESLTEINHSDQARLMTPTMSDIAVTMAIGAQKNA